MDLHLKDKVVVITGGTTGIGRACVDAFLSEGSMVAICARSESTLTECRTSYAGKPFLALQADVADAQCMIDFSNAVVQHFGSLDVWVNNAGTYPAGDLADMPLDMWQRTLNINVNGVLYGARAAIPHLRNRGGGVIINAASFATIMPTAGRGAYGITKAAVGHMTKVLAAELVRDGIRVVSYMPGVVATDLTSDVMAEYKDLLNMQVAQNRFGTPEEIAPIVLFLASEAASFITGSGIEVSGGKYCVQNPYYAWKMKE